MANVSMPRVRGVAEIGAADQGGAPAPAVRGEVGLGPAAHVDPRAAARADLQTLDAIIDGRLDPREGLRRIAMAGGLPIVVDGRTVFVSDAGAELAVAGEHSGWARAPMQRRGPVQVLEVQGELRGAYKVVTEAGEWRSDPWSRAYAHDEHGEISLIRPRGEHLARFPLVSGFGLPPRTVRVRVPAEPPTHHVYMQDGQNLFDPASMWGGWKVDEAAGPRTLVVGVDNTGGGRFDEYTHTTDRIGDDEVGGRADAYADLLVSVIRPHIEATYGRPRRTGVLGSSLGGLAAFAAAARHPNAFDFVGAMSATFGWGQMGDAMGNPTMLDVYRGQPRHRRPKFYLDSGGQPGGRDNYDPTIEMTEVLAERGYRWGKDLWHWHEPDAPHRETAWAARVHRPLRLFESL